MNKRTFFLLLALWLAWRAAASAYYDPTTKTFLSRDPIREEGGINLYAYCENDPIGNFDPIGLADGPLGQLNDKIGKLELRARKAGRKVQRTLDTANYALEHYNREVARINARIGVALYGRPELPPGEILRQTALGLFVDPVRGLFTRPDFSSRFFWKEVYDGEWNFYLWTDPSYNPRLLAGIAGTELLGGGAMSLASRARLPAVRFSGMDFLAEARARLNAVKAQYGYLERYGMATKGGSSEIISLWKGPAKLSGDLWGGTGELLPRDVLGELAEGFDPTLYPGKGPFFGVGDAGRLEAVSWANYYGNGLQQFNVYKSEGSRPELRQDF